MSEKKGRRTDLVKFRQILIGGLEDDCSAEERGLIVEKYGFKPANIGGIGA